MNGVMEAVGAVAASLSEGGVGGGSVIRASVATTLAVGAATLLGGPGVNAFGGSLKLDPFPAAMGDREPTQAPTITVSSQLQGGSFLVNLIVNGNAESGLGKDDGSIVSIPGWSATGAATVVTYNTAFDGLTPTTPGPADRGLNYFAGGPANSGSSLTQTINLSGYTAVTDLGAVQYTLGGYFGGWTSQDDHASLQIDFRDAGHVTLGTATVGAVLASDRGSATGIFYRQTTGLVPIGAREATLTLSMVRNAGTYNDGYADNLSLVLVPEPRATLGAAALGLGAFLVGRRIRRVRRA